MEIYDTKVYIIVQSKYPEMLATFNETFLPTTKKFKNLALLTEDGERYGAAVINEHIEKARVAGFSRVGVFNDDLWFSEGWLESVLPFFEDHHIVSPGYVETIEKETFEKAVERTKNEKGYVNHFYGPTGIYRMDIFKRIGMFDERFDWTCDDLDWSLRAMLNGLSTITLKKITTAHFHGQTRNRSNESISSWWAMAEKNKQRFYDKNGYINYRKIKAEHLLHHQYFKQFK